MYEQNRLFLPFMSKGYDRIYYQYKTLDIYSKRRYLIDEADGYYLVSTSTLNQWVHGVMVYHGEGLGITVYQDGRLIQNQPSKVTVDGTKPTGNGNTIVGKRERYVSMLLDEVKMYNRQLSQGEIQNMY